MANPSPQLRIVRLPHGLSVELPQYASVGASGLDIRARVDTSVVITPGASALIPTGLALEIPAGYEGQVRPRSGLALKHRLMVVNSPGTIDADYRGELKIILGNFGAEPFTVNDGDRIAQLVIGPVTRVEIHEAAELSGTVRGVGGFGSTGKS